MTDMNFRKGKTVDKKSHSFASALAAIRDGSDKFDFMRNNAAAMNSVSVSTTKDVHLFDKLHTDFDNGPRKVLNSIQSPFFDNSQKQK